jgi:hypothetical protein
MLRIQATLCYARLCSQVIVRCLPRASPSIDRQTSDKHSDYAVINANDASSKAIFNDYKLGQPSSVRIQSRPLPKTIPKLIDIQQGLNEYLQTCDENMLLVTIEARWKLVSTENIALFIQRLQQLNIKRSSNERHHRRFYDFVDYFSK